MAHEVAFAVGPVDLENKYIITGKFAQNIGCHDQDVSQLNNYEIPHMPWCPGEEVSYSNNVAETR